MPLLNYTTSVPVSRTISEMTKLVARLGARQVMTSFDDAGDPSGLSLSLSTDYGMRTFTLPIDVDVVHNRLVADPKVTAAKSSREQAARVAWRIGKDWLEVQVAIVEAEMVKFDQVMLPYMHDDRGQTMWQLYRAQQLALGSGS